MAAELDTLQLRLGRLSDAAKRGAPLAEMRRRFSGCRAPYKRIEAFVEYYYPAAALRLNGAALPEAEPSEPEEPLHPGGFQVLEEVLFGADTANGEMRLAAIAELSNMDRMTRRIRSYVAADPPPEAREVFEALRLNLHRLIAKGLSGFDSPVALASMEEAALTLEGLKEILRLYGTTPAILQSTDRAIALLRSSESFEAFDRMAFLRDHLLPLMEAWHLFQREAGIPFPDQLRALRPEAAHFFAAGAFDPLFFAPGRAMTASGLMIALGKALFYEPALSGGKQRSCGSCHKPELAFTDGLALNESLTGEGRLMRNTPTLLNAALQPAQFADSRTAFLEDQIHDVVSNRQEMGGDWAGIAGQLKKLGPYRKLVADAFPGESDPWKKARVKEALAAYVRSLSAMNSRFDRHMRAEPDAMSGEEVLGFNLFMGKAKCGTCHYAPLFSGAVPPLYDKMESEVLGVPVDTDTLHPRLDPDPGKFGLYRMPHQMRAFKTPGLRNVALTAPYMHNGIYRTLDEVMDFYERGGGAGLGLDVPNQTLPPDRLHLTPTERRAVIAFMRSLTDTSAVGR